MGGFVERESSLTISIIKHDKATHGILLQPESNVSQHLNGLSILESSPRGEATGVDSSPSRLHCRRDGAESFKTLFNGKGQIHKKFGSKNV